MITGFLILVGIVGYQRLNVALLPELEVPRIYLITRFPGMAPTQVENMVTVPLEKAIAGTDGLDSITSRSERGVSIIQVSFRWNTGRESALIELRQNLNRVYVNLPESAGRTRMLPYDPSRKPLILIKAESEALGKGLRFFVDTVLRSELEQTSGVAALEIDGGFIREVQVDLEPGRLYGHGLDIRSVVRGIQSQNISRPLGRVESGRFEKMVRMESKAESIAAIRRIPIARKKKGTVYLSDVASVQKGFAERSGQTLVNGKPSVVIGLRKEPSANTLTTAANILESIHRVNRKYKGSVHLTVLENRAKSVHQAIESIQMAAIPGALLAFLVLILFLRNIQSALLVALTVPVSLLISMGFLDILGVSLNIMSLSGIILGIGMLMDGSIVVTESIRSVFEQHSSPHGNAVRMEHSDGNAMTQDESSVLLDTVVNGTSRVLGTLIASTGTTIIVFLPINFVSGIAAALFQDLALAVIVSLLAGLYCSCLLIPVLTILTASTKRPPLDANGFPSSLAKLQSLYRVSMNRILLRPVLTVTLASGCVAFGLWIIAELPRSVMPRRSPDTIVARLSLPPGTPYKVTASQAAQIQSSIQNHFSVQDTIIHAGHENDDPSEVVSGKAPESEASILIFPGADCNGKEVMKALRNILSAGSSARLDVRARAGPIQNIIQEAKGDYELSIRKGSGLNPDQLLRNIARDLRSRKWISVGNRHRQPQPVINLELRRNRASSAGLSPLIAARHIRSSLHGTIASTIDIKDSSVDIRVRLKDSFQNPRKFKKIRINTDKQRQVSLQGLLDFNSILEKPPRIRRDQKPVHKLRFRLNPEYPGQLRKVRSTVRQQIKRMGIHSRIKRDSTFEIHPANKKAMNSLRNLAFAFGFSCILVFQLLAAQFESPLHALGLILSVPAMLPAAGLALGLTGQGLNIGSGIGIIMLTGIVINSSIALFEEMEFRKKKQAIAKPIPDEYLRNLIIESGVRRIRPILLTALTTIGGILPLALGSGSENQKPMATVIVAGLALGTLACITTFPCFYYLIERRRK
tara:strand:- start:7821 stop:10928 length:3108 start_codon:yes stop_codon:yes gene_type:complete